MRIIRRPHLASGANTGHLLPARHSTVQVTVPPSIQLSRPVYTLHFRCALYPKLATAIFMAIVDGPRSELARFRFRASLELLSVSESLETHSCTYQKSKWNTEPNSYLTG